MPRINDTNIYPYDSLVTLYDYLIGSDADSSNKRTLNYKILDIANLILNTINAVDSGSRVLSGSVFPIGGLNWASTPIVYTHGGVIQVAPAVSLITLDEPETDKRIDVFAVNFLTNTLEVVQGVESENPSEPTIDFESQIRVTSALLENGETNPDGVSYEYIYNEYAGEPTEWTTTATTVSGSFDLEFDEDYLEGVKCILGKSLKKGDRLTFLNDTNIDASTISFLNFAIKNVNVSDLGIKIYLLNGSDIVSDVVYVYNNFFGYDLSNTDWHYINIPIFNFSPTQSFDTIRFDFSELGATDIDEVLLDRVVLISGNNNSSVSDWLSLTDTDNTYENKAGYIPVVTNTEDGLQLTDPTSLTTNVSKTITPDTGDEINNNNPVGNECNFSSANTNSEFTLTGEGGWAITLINRATEPTFANTPAPTKLVGGEFQANTDMYLITRHTSDGYQYWWSYVVEIPETPTTGGQRQRAVISIAAANEPPPSNNDGDRYIIDFTVGTKHPSWGDCEKGEIVQNVEGVSWDCVTPVEGMVAYVDDENKDAIYVDDGTPAWELVANSSSFDFYNESGSVVGEDAVALVGNLNPATFTGSGSFWQLSNPGGGVISTVGSVADNIQLGNDFTSMVATSGLILSEAALGTALTGAVINIKGNILTDVPANSVSIEGLAVGIDTPFFGVGDIEEAGNGMQIGITDASSLIALGDINDVNNGTQLRVSDDFERIELRAGSATNVYAMLETSNLSSSRLIEFQDKNIVVAGLEDIAKTPNSDAGTTIDNNNPLGREYNFTSANSNTEFTLTGTGGWASTLINAASEPTFTNETIEKLAGGTFIANTDIYLITRHTADGYQYWWSYKTITPDIDADTLESLTASQFLRSDVADIKTTGDLVLNNNIKLGLGTSSRNTLYSNGTDQLIIDLISDDYLAIKDNGTTRFSFGRTDGLFSTTNIVAESFKSEGTIATTNIIATIGDHSNGFRGTKVKVDDALRLAAMGDVDLQSNGLRIMINNTTGAFTIGDDTGVNGGTHIDIDDPNGEIDLNADTINVDGVVNLKSYTVATLPTGTEGDLAYITDGAAVPTWRATATGGGSLKILVFFDGTNWIYH